MTVRWISIAAFAVALTGGSALAQDNDGTLILTNSKVAQASDETAVQEDDLVRLPGQGQGKLKRGGDGPRDGRRGARTRLVAGGGLLVSFDRDSNGSIDADEVTTGARLAFIKADTNGDDELTALEQQDWADNLPTRDETLSNPARFDPNLDRIVTQAEFVSVIEQIAAAYRPDGSTILTADNLAALEQRAEREDRAERRPRGQKGEGRPRSRQ